MAAFDTTRPAYGSVLAVSRIASFFADTIANVVSWNDARVTRNALATLTDRELEDIGLVRGDIDTIAKGVLIR